MQGIVIIQAMITTTIIKIILIVIISTLGIVLR